MNRALVITNHLHSFAGSEIVAIEISEQLCDLGFKVDLRANALSLRVARTIDRRVSISDCIKRIPWSIYDVIWAQHDMLNHSLPYRLKKSARIFSAHLSPYHFREHLGLHAATLRNADFIVNSDETRRSLLSAVDSRSIVTNFFNACPSNWFQGQLAREELGHLAIISNHPPPEVLCAVKLLKHKGIKVTIFGKGYNYKRLRPEDLNNIDAVLTIGKSVQYSIAANLPAFIYDSFGGPGWLNASNFSRAESFNFSGRCTARHYSHIEIANLLIDGFTDAKRSLADIRKNAVAKYDLEVFLRSQIFKPYVPKVSKPLNEPLARALAFYAEISRREYRRSHWPNVLHGKFYGAASAFKAWLFGEV